MEFNARLPIGTMWQPIHAASCHCVPHVRVPGCRACTERLGPTLRKTSFLLGRPHPGPWLQLVTRCRQLSTPYPVQISLRPEDPGANNLLAISTWKWHRPFKCSMPQTNPITSWPRFASSQLVSTPRKMVPPYIQPPKSKF